MKIYSLLLLALPIFFTACGDDSAAQSQNFTPPVIVKENEKSATRHFKGVVHNGMKGDSISFDISADGSQLQNLTFKGYWRCSGRLESIIAGPDGHFTIQGNKVQQHISEPPDGGSTAWRFDLNADIDGNKASGKFRMNINNLGCDTYLLEWTATEAN